MPQSNVAKPQSNASKRLVSLLAPVPWALLFFELLLIVPRYEKHFSRYGLRPTGLVQSILEVGRWMADHALVAFSLTFVLIAVSIGTTILLQSAAISKRLRYLALLVVFGIPCTLFAIVWVGIDQTQRRLEEGLNR